MTPPVRPPVNSAYWQALKRAKQSVNDNFNEQILIESIYQSHESFSNVRNFSVFFHGELNSFCTVGYTTQADKRCHLGHWETNYGLNESTNLRRKIIARSVKIINVVAVASLLENKKAFKCDLEEKPQLPCAQTCHTPHPSMIEKGWINEQTSLAVVINVHLPVFLMGHLIKNLLVAAGLLSHPISAPPCQNLCHRPSLLHLPIPLQLKHVPRVSYDICVSRSCDGMLLRLLCLRRCSLLADIHFAAMLLLAAVAERPVTGWEVGRLESRFKRQWLRNQRELMQLPSITARCVHFKLDENPHLPGAYGAACTRLSSSSSSVTDRGRSCLYLDAAQETVSSQMLLSGFCTAIETQLYCVWRSHFGTQPKKVNEILAFAVIPGMSSTVHLWALSHNVIKWKLCNLLYCVRPPVI